MSKEEMQKVLAEELARLRSWTYGALSEFIERTRRDHEYLDHVERVSPDGTSYFMDFEAFWDDKPNADIRVCGSLWADPQRKLLGFLPAYMPHCTDSFIMSPSGQFIGEDEHTTA